MPTLIPKTFVSKFELVFFLFFLKFRMKLKTLYQNVIDKRTRLPPSTLLIIQFGETVCCHDLISV